MPKSRKPVARVDLVTRFQQRVRAHPLGSAVVLFAVVIGGLSSVVGGLSTLKKVVAPERRDNPVNFATPLKGSASNVVPESGAGTIPSALGAPGARNDIPGRSQTRGVDGSIGGAPGVANHVAPRTSTAVESIESDWAFQPDSASPLRNVLELQLTSAFRSARYNTEPYLRAISDIELEGDWRVSRREVAMNGTAPKAIRALLVLHGGAEARKEPWLRLSLGPHRDSIRLPRLTWEKKTPSKPHDAPAWWLARAEATISLPEPAWPSLVGARLLAVADSTRDLLEITVHNLSAEAVGFQEVVVLASEPRQSTTTCAEPDRPQQVTLDWKRVLATRGPTAGWATLGTDTVGFVAEMWQASRCSVPSFRAEIPVAFDLAPGAIGRITLDIRRAERMRATPLTWPEFTVGLRPSHVFPHVVSVSR